MNPVSPPSDAETALIVELIARTPTNALDEVLRAVCDRVRAVDETEVGHPSQVERAARLLDAFACIHLAPIIYDALDARSLRALLVLSLDRFAIDGPPHDVAFVAAAARRFVHAVEEPAVLSRLLRSST